MAAEETLLPSTSDACAAAAAKPRPSALRRAKDRVAAHCSAVSALLADHEDDEYVEFADAALRALQALLHGLCVPSVEIARLHRLSHAYARDDAAGTRALSLLGRALRSLSIARNEHYTLADGLEPDEYGLPRIKVKPPRFYSGESDENISPGGTHSQSVQRTKRMKQHLHRHHTAEPMTLFEGDIPPEEDTRDLSYTNGFLTGMTSNMDLSFLSNRREERDDKKEKAGSSKAQPKKKYRPDDPAPPFELKRDEAGNIMVKSEMMGDDEFFDHQIQMREFANRYEAIARTGEYEERFISKKLTGRGSNGKIYECDTCHLIFPNQHKFATHKRWAHPKNSEQRAQAAAAKAERRAAAAAAPVVILEREKRERRPPVKLDQMVSLATTTSPPVSTKIYTCPICTETLDTQHKFASHMRYKHPKGSLDENMEGRRASITPNLQAMAAASSSSSNSLAVPASSPMSSSMMEQKEEETPKKKYACRICARPFDNYNGLAGHTRHCQNALNLSASSPALASPSNGIAASSTTSSSMTKKRSYSVVQTPSTMMKEKEEEVVMKKEEETPKKTYACHICARPFDNYNALAGHTRHCQRVNGIDPSPRAMQRRVVKAATDAAAAAAAPAAVTTPTTVRLAKISPLAVPSSTPPLETKETKEEEKAVAAKPVKRKRPASLVVQDDSADEQQLQPTSVKKEEPAASSPAADTTPAAPTVTTTAKAKVARPFTMLTRSSRSRVPPSVSSSSLAEPSPSLPPSAKRMRTEAPPTPNREVKEESSDDEETESVKGQSKRVKRE